MEQMRKMDGTDDCPCKACGFEVRCKSRCKRWEEWFSREWRSLQNLYLGGGSNAEQL